MRYGRPLSPPVEVRDGDDDALAGASLVMLTVGINERAGGATDREDHHDHRGHRRRRSYDEEYGVTLSLPSVVGRCGVVRRLAPALSDEERSADKERSGLQRSAEVLRNALASATS
jgi:malate/lactate dehydrogenase